MTKIEIQQCAAEAFDAVAKEFESTMGKPTLSERRRIMQPLIRALATGAQMPNVATLPTDRKRSVIIDAGKRMMRKFIETT